MNILQKITIIFIAIFTFSSCTTNDSNLFEYTVPETKTIVGVLESDQNLVAQGDPITVTYTLPQSFATDVILEIKSTAGVGNDSFFDITIAAGDTTGQFDVTPDQSVGFAGQKITIEMTGLKQVVFEDVTNDDGDIVSRPTVIDGDDIVIESNQLDFLILSDYEVGKANFKFGWDDTSDFDVIVVDAAGTQIADSQTGANPEEFKLDDTLADGDYTVKIVYYGIEDDNSIVYFHYRNSEAVISYVEFNLSGYTQDTGAQIPVFTLTKSGINYTITQL